MSDWIRKGECNNCGWCCAFIGQLTIFHPTVAPEAFEYWKMRGMVLKPMNNKVEGRVDAALFAPCPNHDVDKMACNIYENRPTQCREFPTSPGQIVHTPCSYYFTRNTNGAEENIGGEGSPYPL